MKVTCAQCQRLMSDLYDDALHPDVRRLVLEHLSVCDSCRSEFRALQSSLGALASLGDEHADESFLRVVVRKARLVLREDNQSVLNRRVSVRRGPLLGAAALLQARRAELKRSVRLIFQPRFPPSPGLRLEATFGEEKVPPWFSSSTWTGWGPGWAGSYAGRSA